MVTSSRWWATRTVNSKTSDFVRSLTHREHQAMFELLPPQRAALLEPGLLDQAKTAIDEAIFLNRAVGVERIGAGQ